MDFTSEQGRRRYDRFVGAASLGAVGLDFDGTLSPIVDDPQEAHIHPDAAEVLLALAGQVRAVAVITGRPVRQVLELGDLERLGRSFEGTGTALHVFGQYGNERWSSEDAVVHSPEPPAGLAPFEDELPGTLERLDAAGAWVEDKGLAVAVHTRRLADAQEAFDRLLPALRELAERHDLAVEPGRNVIEVRAPGVDKGGAVATLVDDLGLEAFCFAGDDLGDLDAFTELERREGDSLATLRVCSASEEEGALLEHADVVVHGPDGVLEVLRRITADADDADDADAADAAHA